MIDYLWAVFQALQEYRSITYEEDCHPGFTANLAPFSDNTLNNNEATRSHSHGIDTVDYKAKLGYKYDSLTLHGKTIPELDEFLSERNKKDRFFVGFSLPDIQINKITFQICDQNKCSPTISTPVTKVHRNKEA